MQQLDARQSEDEQTAQEDDRDIEAEGLTLEQLKEMAEK